MSADPTGERQEYAQAAEASVPVSEIEALAERLAADADTRLRGMAAKWARDTSYDLRALVAAAKGGGDR